ncbi:condensation domain-containing protein, partial [Pantanalinema sp. GBBB05]|uniref:condensation domain-containing protein n=1 Tax=Pantanalinema sp. GBBB05 TaxID=2604139 RepID=UPI003D81BBFD
MQANLNPVITIDLLDSAPAVPPVTHLWQLVRDQVRVLHDSPPIQRAPRQHPLPLSWNQERLWQLERLQPATSVHTLVHSIRFVGTLNLAVLEQSLQDLVRRHDVLRTTIAMVHGQPTQVITPEMEVPLYVIDLQEQSASEQARVLAQQTQLAGEQVFDLAQGPLWRLVLVQLSERESVLLRSIHHLIFDGQSHSVFMRELGALYGAFARGEASPLLELPVQYADVAWTQRHWLQGAVLAEQMAYWQQQFGGDVEALVLPTLEGRTVAGTYRGASVRRVLPVAVSAGLNALSAAMGVSLFVTLLAGFNA